MRHYMPFVANPPETLDEQGSVTRSREVMGLCILVVVCTEYDQNYKAH